MKNPNENYYGMVNVGADLRVRPGWAINRAAMLMGEGQAQGLPLQGVIMPAIIWSKMPMCRSELNHPDKTYTD